MTDVEFRNSLLMLGRLKRGIRVQLLLMRRRRAAGPGTDRALWRLMGALPLAGMLVRARVAAGGRRLTLVLRRP